MRKILNVATFIVFIVISFAAAKGFISSVQSKYLLAALLVLYILLYYKDKIMSRFRNKK